MSIDNRYRITPAQQNLVVQHPGTNGHWCRLCLDPLRSRSFFEKPQPRWEDAGMAPLAERCAQATYLFVDVGEFYDDLIRGGPERTSPSFATPSIEDVSLAATPWHGGRPITSSAMSDVATVAIVAVVLAWRGGEAREYELEDDLSRVLGGRDAADMARYVARARSGGNIVRGDRRWSMREAWAVPSQRR